MGHTGSIECTEEENKERNQRHSSTGLRRYQEATARRKKTPSHVGEGKQQQIATPKSVHRPDGREGEYERGQSEPQGSE